MAFFKKYLYQTHLLLRLYIYENRWIPVLFTPHLYHYYFGYHPFIQEFQLQFPQFTFFME